MLVLLLACDDDPAGPTRSTVAADTGTPPPAEPPEVSPPTGDTGAVDDVDGDGFREPRDCDDADPAVNPDAFEVENGVDDDCDGRIDVESLADADTVFDHGMGYDRMILDGPGDADGDGLDDVLLA